LTRASAIQEIQMKTKIIIAGIVGASALAGGVALAHMQDSGERHGMMHGQMHGGMHSGMRGGMEGGMRHGGSHGGSHAATLPKGDQGPSSLAFAGVNAKMHQGMDITYSGNADRDFVQGMIPHHQGAVDMAKIVLAFGKDPEVRKLAENIVKAQEDEIAWMNSWQQKNASK
jgi:uncharacterized protein (DUF305 family)